MRSALLLLTSLAATPAAALDCYHLAQDSARAGDFDGAGAIYEAYAERPDCASSKALLLVSAGNAYVEAAKATGRTLWWCRAAGAFEAARAIEDNPYADAAALGHAQASARCATAPPPPPPPPPPPSSDLDAGVDPPPDASPEPDQSPPDQSPSDQSPPDQSPPPPPPEAPGSATPWLVAGLAAAAALGVTAVLLLSRDDEDPPAQIRVRVTSE